MPKRCAHDMMDSQFLGKQSAAAAVWVGENKGHCRGSVCFAVLSHTGDRHMSAVFHFPFDDEKYRLDMFILRALAFTFLIYMLS